jgi:hypothetical protein
MAEGIEPVPQLQCFDFESHCPDGSCLLRELSPEGSDLRKRALQRRDFSKDEWLSGFVECVDVFHQNRARIRAIMRLVTNDAASNVDPPPTRSAGSHRISNIDLQYRFIQRCAISDTSEVDDDHSPIRILTRSNPDSFDCRIRSMPASENAPYRPRGMWTISNVLIHWRAQGESNPCFRRERATS